MMKHTVREVVDKLVNWLFLITLLFVVFLMLHVFCFASFKIPSDSMRPELVPGDYVIVNKMIRGARLFNVLAALNNDEFNIYRMPGLGKIERNDILVFNFPFPHRKDSVSFDIMSYYIKRCIALPGDSIEIINAHYRVRGFEDDLGNIASQDNLALLLKNDSTSTVSHIVTRSYPRDRKIGWSIKDFGPFYLPEKGKQIAMNRDHVAIYRPLIEWEQHKKLRWIKGKTFLDDDEIFYYTFKSNYYFVSGDKVENSKDSRYWGALPEEFIVGKASFIWKSEDISDGKTRWKRTLKEIK